MFLLVVSFLFPIIVVVSIYLYLPESKSHMEYVKMPPCLYRYIFLGNIPYLLKKKTPVHTYFEFLSKDIGSVFTFWFGDCPAVIINDFQMAKKLLYSKECTGRPQRYTGEMYSRGFKGNWLHVFRNKIFVDIDHNDIIIFCVFVEKIVSKIFSRRMSQNKTLTWNQTSKYTKIYFRNYNDYCLPSLENSSKHSPQVFEIFGKHTDRGTTKKRS